MSGDELRDILFPVTLTARRNAASQGYPLTDFKQLRDQVLTLGRGVHGVRETFDYTYQQQADTWDMDALTDAPTPSCSSSWFTAPPPATAGTRPTSRICCRR